MTMHYSVLLSESIEGLNIKSDGIYVDCTLGYGGHSEEILKRLNKSGHLYAFEQDSEAIKYSSHRLAEYAKDNLTIIHDNFVNLKTRLDELGIDGIDGIIFDLGFSSPQIDDPNRGFSFMKDAKLDMRMNKENKLSAYDVVNSYKESELTNIFYKYAEEKYSRIIARNIVKNRPIESTLELVDVIVKSVPTKYAMTRHPERVIFQAIRIEVNNELNALESVLPDAIDMLNQGARISVITFHSLEDRIVKQTFKLNSEISPLVKGLPEIPEEYKPKLKLINKKPILPTEKECMENSRSKSAKLRIVERV
ncbi:MAG: 16S rRNA (cytosine(1402)-N(4))-methyltransferase RsmH [Erysipelotrichales bacterium]|nr:16S rRNA (cytosine(1402)-N(4))-methyltransferase RsmH [Erysipelotrichales bacterium]